MLGSIKNGEDWDSRLHLETELDEKRRRREQEASQHRAPQARLFNMRTPGREEIETDFVNWKSPSAILEKYSIIRTPLYRRAAIFDLLSKRRVVVAAVQALARINSQEQWVERTEHTNMNELFNRMTDDEKETYIRAGKLPGWF